MTEQQAQNITAHLALARTAIDNAELRIVGAPDAGREGPQLVRATAEINAAAGNLEDAAKLILEYALGTALEGVNGNRTR